MSTPTDDNGTPAALAGQAQRLYDMLTIVLIDLSTLDRALTIDIAEQFSANLLRRFHP